MKTIPTKGARQYMKLLELGDLRIDYAHKRLSWLRWKWRKCMVHLKYFLKLDRRNDGIRND